MAKKGQEIEELYISLGLNLDDLKLGFDTAGKTVSQAITRLNSENKKIQVKTDLDMSKLEGVGSELDKIKLKYEAINAQLDIQRQKEINTDITQKPSEERMKPRLSKKD